MVTNRENMAKKCMTKGNVTLTDIYRAIEDFRKEVRETYVTKSEFEPVKNSVFTFIGLIMVSVIGAILTVIIRTK